MKLSNNETQFFNTWTLGEENQDLKQALLYLNQKMNEINRSVSFWDVYNITQVLLNDNDLVSKIPLLNIGEAAIVNTNIITSGDTPRYRGDIAYRQSNGEILWISAENKGIYKPNIFYDETEGSLKIQYNYDTKPAQEGETETFEIKCDENDAYLIDVNVSASTGDVHFENGTCTFDAILINGSLLRPMIKFYYSLGNSRYEEFYGDYYWVYNSSATPKTISVTIDFATSSIIQNLIMRVR